MSNRMTASNTHDTQSATKPVCALLHERRNLHVSLGAHCGSSAYDPPAAPCGADLHRLLLLLLQTAGCSVCCCRGRRRAVMASQPSRPVSDTAGAHCSVHLHMPLAVLLELQAKR